VRIDIRVDGVSDGAPWSCGLATKLVGDVEQYGRPVSAIT